MVCVCVSRSVGTMLFIFFGRYILAIRSSSKATKPCSTRMDPAWPNSKYDVLSARFLQGTST